MLSCGKKGPDRRFFMPGYHGLLRFARFRPMRPRSWCILNHVGRMMRLKTKHYSDDRKMLDHPCRGFHKASTDIAFGNPLTAAHCFTLDMNEKHQIQNVLVLIFSREASPCNLQKTTGFIDPGSLSLSRH
ncbi:hypothetical protein METBIDRAFT_182111 [Metschnikowia bicuspidata var. bicuspidata NRRL YB-4993]|uniref:Uncharacterized protein n=1 Tax=Metschnikowia bicuspidata var. bicuspidata NRRL YB-4993 TaxID=869754 RepID=A0A1A0HBI9_9ASCO|nr:hypothetical protein METBIDRAFT_182111 [Metschnikowia bicuspidata var. bicuspidata NRRL YB-4993]OBA21376.1 hypothetical protein METBIDRAFT_182111 [Metschnikowia bicuspidata var. bicuspidata NRRL YB-4993]